MKKHITCTAFTLLISALFSIAAEDNNLEIVMTQAAITGQKEVSAYVYKTKTHEPRTSYDYKFYCLVKNVGDADLLVATKGLGSSISMDGKGGATIILSFDQKTYKGSPIIPSEADLGLVLLHPNESAEIVWEQSSIDAYSKGPLSLIKVQYNPRDQFDNRFGYWTGRVTGEPVEMMAFKQ